MKRIVISMVALLFSGGMLFSQTPELFNYQAVARNTQGSPILSQNIGLRISIIKTSPTGTTSYVEIHNTQTNGMGLFSVLIGGGSPMSGSMTNIDWSSDTYYLKVEMDGYGGVNYQLMGTTQLLSVPYAIHAKTAESFNGIEELRARLSILEETVGSMINPPINGLVAYYPFNGNVNDESGNGHNATNVNAILSEDRFGETNSAYQFDGYTGTDRYIHSSINSQDFVSVSLWFQCSDPTTWYPTIYSYGGSNRVDLQIHGNHPLYIDQNKVGELFTGVELDGAWESSIIASNNYADNQWHHVVVIYNPDGKLYLYVDNELIDQVPFTGRTQSINNFFIGKIVVSENPQNSSRFDGSIDDIRIYDRAISAFEVGLLYRESK